MKMKFVSFRPFVCLAAVVAGLSAFALPAGYTRVSCIEGTGGYALTDYVPRPDEDEIEFTFASVNSMGANFVLFSSRPEDASIPDGFIGAFYYGGERQMRFDYNGGAAQVTAIPAYRDEVIYTLVLKDGVLGERHGGVLASLPHADFTPTNGVCIFAQLQGKDTANIGHFRFYRMKVTRNGEVIHDFVPVKNASGVGMIVDDVTNPATVQMVTLNHSFGVGSAQQPLTLEVGEGGSVLLNGEPASAGIHSLAAASDAQLTAVPAEGYQFWRWEGDVEDEFRGSPEAKVSMLKGSTARALFLPAETAKPAFTPVDWIRGADLNFFFETDYVPNPTTDRIVAEMMFPSAGDGNHRGVWCARDVDGTNTKDGRYTFLYASNDGLSFQFGNTSSGVKVLVAVKNISSNVRYQFTADQNVASVYANGVLAGRYSYAVNPSFTAAGGPVCLLANYTRPTDLIRVCAADARLYSFRIYRNGVLIHNLQPAIDANGVATLVDTCAAEPMALVRHGSFTYGAVAKRVTVDAIGCCFYTGEAVEPAVTVRDVETGEPVDVAANFDVAYGDNVEPGWGRVILTAKAGSPYEGQVLDAPFSIAQILHVTPEAAGGGNGRSWATAMTFAEAVAAITDKGGEIWLKTGTYAITSSPTESTQLLPKAAIAVRGGFSGTEESADERLASGLSTIDGQGQFAMFWVTSDAALSFERLRFVRTLYYVLRKRGSGDVSFERCELVGNRYGGASGIKYSSGAVSSFASYSAENMGGLIHVAGSTTQTRFSAKDCVFAGNALNGTTGLANGGVVGLAKMNEAVFENCYFATNSMATGQGQGLACAVYDVPVRFSGCEFRANVAHSSRATLVSVFGGWSSTLESCLFAGNDVSGDGSATSGRGLFYTWESEHSASVKHSVCNCTFAYNIGSRYIGAVSFANGDNIVKDSIFFANVRAKCTNQKPGADVYAESSSGGTGACYAKVKIEHSLFAEAGSECYWRDNTLAYGSLTTTNCIYADPKFRTTREEFIRLFKVSGALSDATATFPGGDAAMSLDVHLRGSSPCFGLGAYPEDRPTGCMILVR